MNRIVFAVRLAAFTLVVMLLLVSSSMSAKFGKISDEEWNLVAPDDYPEANALIIFERAEIDVTWEVIEIKNHVRILILTQAGVDEASEWSIPYWKKYDKIKHLKAHTISPFGQKQKVEKNAIFKKTVDEKEVITFTFPNVEVGSILELKYQHLSDRHRYLRSWYFQNRLYTLESQVSVTLATGFDYSYSDQNLPPKKRKPIVTERPDINKAGGFTMSKLRTFTWTLNNLPPIKDEPYMSSKNDYRSSLRFSIHTYSDRHNYFEYQKTWPEVGKRMTESFDDYNNKEKDIEKLALEITEGLIDPKEKSEAIYKYVTENFKSSYKYINRWFVHKKISKLLEEGYGSPEGKNLLMAEMHKDVGLEAWPVLISTRDNGSFDTRQAGSRQFNYMIIYAQLGDSWTFLDASSKYAPYGLLPPRCLTDGGFLIDGEKSELVKITTRPVRSYRADVTRMYIDEFGAVTCSTQCTLSGYYASRFGEEFDKAEVDDFFKEHFMGRLGVTWSLEDYKCELDSMGQFVIDMVFTSDDLAEKLDNLLIIKPISFSFRTNPFESEHRFFPVDFNYPFTYHNIVEIFTADSVAEYMIPKDFNSTISGASLTRQSVVKDSSIVVAIKLEVTKPLFSPRRYSELRSFFNLLSQMDDDEVTAVLSESQ